MAFAQELQTMYNAKKAEFLEKREENLERRAKDITLFFEKEVRENAKERMRTRAEQGRPTANILEYQYNERFYVDGDNIVKFIDQEVNHPNYRIHDVVMRDRVFQNLLIDFEKEISSSETPIQFMKWRPRDTLQVIEAVWGKNRYHRTESPRGFVSIRGRGHAGPRRGGRGGGRGRGDNTSRMYSEDA